jgi:hypothetical protein
VISLIAGILIVLQGVLLIVVASLMEQFMHEWSMPHMLVGQAILSTIGAIAFIFGIIVLLGAYLIYSPGKEIIGGILVLVFSIISFFVGGGFLIGTILGIAGGALGLAKK